MPAKKLPTLPASEAKLNLLKAQFDLLEEAVSHIETVEGFINKGPVRRTKPAKWKNEFFRGCSKIAHATEKNIGKVLGMGTNPIPRWTHSDPYMRTFPKNHEKILPQLKRFCRDEMKRLHPKIVTAERKVA